MMEGRGSWKKGMEEGREKRRMSANGGWAASAKGGVGRSAFSVLSFLSQKWRGGGRMGQTEGVMAPRGPSQVGPLAGEGHVYVAKLLFPPPSRLGPTLPASHLPELFPECGIWVREGEGQRGC